MKSLSIGILGLISCVSSYCVTSERPQTPFPTQVNRIGTESTCSESTCSSDHCSPEFLLIKQHMNRPIYQFQSAEQQLFTAINAADIAKIRVILASHTSCDTFLNKKNRTPLIAIAQKLLLNEYKTQEERDAIFTIATLIIQKANNASYFDMQDYKQHTATHYLEKTKVKHARDFILSKMADAFITAIEKKQTQLTDTTA